MNPSEAETTHSDCIVIDTDVEHVITSQAWLLLLLLRTTINELNMSKRAWTAEAREVLAVADYSDTAGTCLALAQDSRCLGWVITWPLWPPKTNANCIGESFPNVNIFMILIFGGHYLDRGPPRFGKAPNWYLRFRFGKWGQGHSKKFILGHFLPFLPILSFFSFPFFLSFFSPRSAPSVPTRGYGEL